MWLSPDEGASSLVDPVVRRWQQSGNLRKAGQDTPLEPTAELAAAKTEKTSSRPLGGCSGLSLGTKQIILACVTPGFGLVTPFYPGHSRPSCGEQKS